MEVKIKSDRERERRLKAKQKYKIFSYKLNNPIDKLEIQLTCSD